jgi:hypothetical protein
MIGSLLYLTVTRPDIQFSVCLCACFQASQRTSHRQDVSWQSVRRIFRYLRYTPELGLWYSASSSLSLLGFSDADFVGCRVNRKSTSWTCQFWDLRLFLGLLANSLVQHSLPQKPSTLLPLVVAPSCFGSHTRCVTLVRSVPMYLSCVIARVSLVLPKTLCSTPEPNT